MSITDELRTSGVCRISPDRDYFTKEELTAIADRIDAEHEKAIRELNNLADSSVFLPVDADGEVIHVGDVMEDADGEVFTVSSIDYGFHPLSNREVAGWMLWSIDAEFYEPANQCRHHHEPTVEDMLWELLGDIRPDMEDEEAVPIVAAYAKRLRLADDKEEQ